MKNDTIIYLLALLCLWSLHAPKIQAQTLDGGWDLPEEKIVKVRAGDDVGRFEAGFDFGYATPLRLGYGIKMDAEARYNMVGTPWDFGLQFAILGVNSPRWGVELNSNAMVSGHVDYNWRLWNNIAPYVGLGVGYYDGTYLNPFTASGHDGKTISSDSAFLSVRAGCEFWDHLRVTAEYRQLFGGAPSVLSLCIGWSFFGGHRR